jgi:hypothetical protein
MSRSRTASLPSSSLATLILCILILSMLSFAAVPDRITQPIVPSQTVRLKSGVAMKARPEFDRGPVDPSLNLSYMTLLTAPSAAQKQALTKLLADQQNPRSASYHKWLTPEQYASRFGLSAGDLQKITTWLQSQGFNVLKTARGGNFVVFSGTAGQVEKAFQVEIHNFESKGEKNFANTSPPAIPSALAGIVTGFRGMNNFRPKSQLKRSQPNYTFAFQGGDYVFLSPGDIKTMYDMTSLYSAGIDGTGQTIAVIGETGIFQSDLTNFRQNFGLSAISCTVSSDIITACDTPNFKYVLVNGSPMNIFGDLPEADLDIEWSGATARNAQIIFVTAIATNVWDSWYYAVDNNVAPVITMSYTAPCELAEAGVDGEGGIISDEAELAQANSQGITFMNSTGDTGSAECDYGANLAEFGYAVGYPASSQYVTGVGGTSIPYTEYNSTYFGTVNGSDGGSALSYVPEQAWNDSLAFAYECEAHKTSGFCEFYGLGNGPLATDWQSAQNQFGIAGGGGGVSNCVDVDDNDVCTDGFPQPSWQSGLSFSSVNPLGLGQVSATHTRFSPDVSLPASANFPGYLVCTQIDGEEGGGSSCDSPTTGIADMLTACLNNSGPCTIFGGTSVSTPIFAGMVSLLNQQVVATGIQPTPGVGNINPTLYQLAAANSVNGAFNPVTTASSGIYSNGAWCDPGTPSSGLGSDPWPVNMICPTSGYAFVGFNSFNSDPTTGYNLATGLGSVNIAHLISAWVASNLPTTTTTLVSSQNPARYGASVTFTATVVTTGSNAPTGTVTFDNNGTSIGTGTLSTVSGNQVATFSTSTLPAPPATNSITAVYGGDTSNAGSTSNAINQVIVAPTFALSTPTPFNPAAPLSGQSTTTTFTVTPGATTLVPITFACNGLPDATVSCAFTPAQIAVGAVGPQPVSVLVTTTGPNSDPGKAQHRKRADNRSPWLPIGLPLAGIFMVGFAGRKMSKYSTVAGLCVSLMMLGLLVACGSSSHPPVSVAVSPSGATMFPNYSTDSWPSQGVTFTPTVTNSSNTAVTWSLSSSVSCTSAANLCGAITSGGAYTAPTIQTGLPASVTVTATSQADTTKTASSTVTLTPTTVPTAVVGAPYSISVTATEGPTSNTTATVPLTVN